jgi:hypothetical protein
VSPVRFQHIIEDCLDSIRRWAKWVGQQCLICNIAVTVHSGFDRQ